MPNPARVVCVVKKRPVKAKKVAPKKSVKVSKPPKRHSAASKPTPAPSAVPATSEPLLGQRLKGDDRLLTLSFLRDGDEFCVRLELANGQITEFKNRSPDQLLTMVAGELEDLLG